MPPKRISRPSATATPAAAPAPLALPRPEGAWRILALVLSLLQPAAGLLLAFFYWRGPEGTVRRFAYWALALALLGWLFEGGSSAVRSGLEGGDWYIQPY